MYIDDEDIKKLKKALIDGFAEGFNKIPRTDASGHNIGDYTNTIDQDARNEYMNRKMDAEEEDKINDLQRQIDKIQANFGDTRIGQEKIDNLKNEQERIRNGGISNKDAKAFKMKQIAGITQAITQVLESAFNIYIAYQLKEIAVSRTYLEYNSKLIQTNLEKQSLVMVNGMKGIAAGFDQNVVEMAYGATQSGYEIAKTAVKTSGEMVVAEKTRIAGLKAAQVEYNTAVSENLVAGGAAIGAAIGTAIAPGVGTAIGAVIGAVGGLITKSIAAKGTYDVELAKLDVERARLASDLMNSYVEKMQKIVEPLDKLYKETSDFVLKLNDINTKFGTTIGLFGQSGKIFANSLIEMTVKSTSTGTSIARLFGEEIEKMPEYLDTYMSAAGRNVLMDVNDMGNVMGTARLFGMSGQESANLYGSMNIFNTSISSASDLLGGMYHQITRMGLSSKQFGKDLVQNLKLAQKYNFKGGVENMMRLTKWAQQVRFNLNNATSFADRIMNSSLSEALEMSAKLQVLGGAAAIYSDPMGMLYDAGADVGSLAQRQANMFKDISATFDKTIGDTKFKWEDYRMIGARAQAMGMSTEDAINMIRQTKKQEAIDEVIGNALDEEVRTAIGNRATYNQKEQKWEVVDIRGEKHDLDYYTNGEGNIEDKLKDLLPADTDEAILTVAEKSLSVLEDINRAVVYNKARLGNAEKNEIYQVIEREQKKLDDFYNQDWSGVLKLFTAAKENSEKMFNIQLENMKSAINNIGLVKNIYKGFETQTRETMSAGLADIQMAARALAGGMAELSNFGVYLSEHGTAEGYMTTKELKEYHEKLIEKLKELNWWPFEDQKDGTGSLNGAIISGANSVKSINDGAVNVKTASDDQYLAARPNGPVDKILQNLIPKMQALIKRNRELSNSAKVNFGGRIMLSQNGSSVDLLQLLKDNPTIMTKIVSMTQRTEEINTTGKSSNNYLI